VMRACVAVARAFVCVFKRKETALSVVSAAVVLLLSLILMFLFILLFPSARYSHQYEQKMKQT
jgi:hypothetical protein